MIEVYLDDGFVVSYYFFFLEVSEQRVKQKPV